MLNKVSELEVAVASIKDGDSVMLGGFGVPGTPFQLIDALVHHGAQEHRSVEMACRAHQIRPA